MQRISIRIFRVYFQLCSFILCSVTFILYFVPVLQEIKAGQNTEITNDPDLKKDAGYKKQMALITRTFSVLPENIILTPQDYRILL